MVHVIEDTPERLVSYIPEGSPFGFAQGNWPTPDGKHPWSNRSRWTGHGCLMIQRPGDPYAIWHFWVGDKREFYCWYINLQEPFRRTAIGYDTQDLELDFIVYPNDEWVIKDAELLDERVEEGRWTSAKVAEIRAEGEKISTALGKGDRWWPLEYQYWSPEPALSVPDSLPDGWETV